MLAIASRRALAGVVLAAPSALQSRYVDIEREKQRTDLVVQVAREIRTLFFLNICKLLLQFHVLLLGVIEPDNHFVEAPR